MYPEGAAFVEDVVWRLPLATQQKLLAEVEKRADAAIADARFSFHRTFIAYPVAEYESNWWNDIFFGLRMGERELPEALEEDVSKRAWRGLVSACMEAMLSCGIRIAGRKHKKKWPLGDRPQRWKVKVQL